MPSIALSEEPEWRDAAYAKRGHARAVADQYPGLLAGKAKRPFHHRESGLRAKPAEWMLHPPGEVYKYAAATGGQVNRVKKKELKEKLALLIDDLRDALQLGYHPSAQKPKGKYCVIKVKLAPEAKKVAGNVVVEARQGYYR